MPELPDVTVYCEAVSRKTTGSVLAQVRIASPFLLRSVTPPVRECEGKKIVGVRRIGKRIALSLEDDLFLVIHLMIAGRLHWKPPRAKLPGRVGLAAFDFSEGSLVLTEASPKKRASLLCVRGEESLRAIDPGGLEVMGASREEFRRRLVLENHTLKRALTDPHLFSGIGNAYSDEILHRARLSPAKRTQSLEDEEVVRLHRAVQTTLSDWTERIRREAGDGFPEKVTAFREGMAVHGRYRQPCPVCGAPVQRIVYAENEANYCARCQTGGKLLADRALSRLLKGDWPRTLEELEASRK